MSNSIKYNWKGKTIIIAEDDDYSFRYLEILITRNGAKVIRTDNGVDTFIECIKNLSIDLALIDIKMPRLNGYEASRLIKKYRPNLMVVAETAFASHYDQKRIRQAGFNDYLLKPIEKDELYYTLNKYLINTENKQLFNSFIYN